MSHVGKSEAVTADLTTEELKGDIRMLLDGDFPLTGLVRGTLYATLTHLDVLVAQLEGKDKLLRRWLPRREEKTSA